MNTADYKPSKHLRVLIAGLATKANEGLAKLLSELPWVIIVGIAVRPIKMLTLSEKTKPDVVLLDLELHGTGLPHTVELLGQITPPPTVIVLAQHVSPVIRRRCEEYGAEFIINKTGDISGLTSALQAIRSQCGKNNHAEFEKKTDK